MGFPTSMFTVLFAVARTVGWIAQWKEMIEDPEQKIGRPRQLYIGATERPYVPIERRVQVSSRNFAKRISGTGREQFPGRWVPALRTDVLQPG